MTQETTAHEHYEQASMSARQRAKKSRSGENVARVILGLDAKDENANERPSTGRHHGTAPRCNFSSPAEFFAGPRQPPRQSSGIRRNPEGNRDTVGLMLTDEYLMINTGAEISRDPLADKANNKDSHDSHPQMVASYGSPAKRGDGAIRQKKIRSQGKNKNQTIGATALFRHADGLTNNCIVTAQEAPWRCGVKMTHPQDPLGAPYFEDTDPRPPRDVAAVTGKRRVKPPYKDSKIMGQMPPLKEGDEEALRAVLQPCHKSSNKTNESVDVLNLYTYTAEELNEKPQPYKQLGPRVCPPPDMPPKKPAVIKPINTPAKQEHDVLGTGRWGVPAKEQPHGLARGACRPPRDTANLFRGGIPQNHHKGSSPDRTGNAPGNRSASQQSRKEDLHHNDGHSASSEKRGDAALDDKNRVRKQLSKKNAGSTNILRYYDPSVDPVPAKPQVRGTARANVESKLDDSNTPYVIGKARGEFYRNSVSSITLV